LTHVVAVVAGVLVVALLLSVAAGVVSRGLGEPFIWTDEVARFLMVWLACFGWILRPAASSTSGSGFSWTGCRTAPSVWSKWS